MAVDRAAGFRMPGLLQLAFNIKAAHSMASHLPNVHVAQAGHCLANQHACYAIAVGGFCTFSLLS
jgi:hypothetical protein